MRSEHSITIRINFVHDMLTNDEYIESQVLALLREVEDISPMYKRTHALRDWNGHIVGEVQVV